MIDPDELIERHRSARLLSEVCRPQSAAVLAQLPARPGVGIAAAEIQRSSGLSPTTFWATVSRLEGVGVLRRESGQVQLDRETIEERLRRWVAGSPLPGIVDQHPRIRPFVAWGRVIRMPTEPDLIDELYAALAQLFAPGEELIESDVNARILAVHDDPAEIRRGLVDRGLLARSPGTAHYRRS